MLSGQDTSGKNFQESTRTLVINKQGAKVLTKYKLALGAELAVENRALGHITKANVVWLGKPPGPNEPAELGIQLIKAENFWGIDFPPEDWEEISAKGGTGAKPQAKAPEKEVSPPPPAPPPVGIGAKPAEPEKPSPGAGSTPGISGPGTLIGVKLPSIPTQPSEPAAPPPPPAPQPTSWTCPGTRSSSSGATPASTCPGAPSRPAARRRMRTRGRTTPRVRMRSASCRRSPRAIWGVRQTTTTSRTAGFSGAARGRAA